ncbi:MAG: hypothetical protein R3B99_17140 [Polyangiales bacterium]
MIRFLAVLVSLSLFGCGDDSSAPVDASSPDGSVDSDARVADAPTDCDPLTLAAHDDERVARGASYTSTLVVTGGEATRFRKTYGPDALTVDASGALRWDVPATERGDTHYVGVRAYDRCGASTDALWLLTVGDAGILRVGAAREHTTIRSAIAAAESGDTLVLDDGVYEGEANDLNANPTPAATPPSGSDDAFTTVIAAHPGEARVQSALLVAGKWGNQHHLAFKGLSIAGSVSVNGEGDERPHHLLFVHVGAEAGFFVSRADDVLFEGCYAYGDGRYKMSAYLSARVIFRRGVARLDHASLRGDVSPYGTFIAYSSTDVAFQNVIDVDSDQRNAYPDPGEATGAFGVPVTAGNSLGILYDRVIVLNSSTKLASYDGRGDGAGGSTYSDVLFRDLIGWDIRTVPGLPDLVHGFGQGRFLHATIGHVRPGADLGSLALFNGYGNHVVDGEMLFDEYRDSLFLDLEGRVFVDVERVSYDGFYQVPDLNADGPAHETETFRFGDTMPLRHLLEADASSWAAGGASDGSMLGATVTTFVGRSGTFHGEPGWDEETEISMWPFPHEEVIARHMGAYRFEGALQDGREVSVRGDRGFAAPGNALDGGPRTLSAYVWEYLGAPCPAERCR